MIKNFRQVIFILTISLFMANCRTVSRYAKGKQVKDISGDWNDTDYRETSKELANKIASAYWKDKFLKKNNRPPRIMVGTIKNRTSEHGITRVMNILVSKIEQELLQEGVIVSGNQVLRKEIAQNGLTPEIRHILSDEISTDYIILGEITILEDVYKKKEVRTYMITLSLIDIATGNKILIVTKDDIRKYIKG